MVDAENIPSLTGNYDLCKRRLNSLMFRLKKDPKLLEQYDDVFQEQLSLGIIERVKQSEYESSEAHFLPHQPVIKIDRDTTKCRVVFDASAKYKDKQFCLNDYLEEGPNTIPNIFDVLISFRSKPVGLTADIQSAFLQIGIDPIDREKMRFLWYENVNSCEQPKLVQYRFARLMFGLKPSPPILGKVVQHHLSFYEDTEPEVVNELKKLYVDDLATSSETDHKAYQTYKTAKQIMSEGRFNLRKWRTNSKTLLKRINEAEKLPFDDTQLDKDLRENVKVVGLC